MTNMLYTKNYKSIMQKMLQKDFKLLLMQYDYTSCEIYLKMLNDLLAGASSYKIDPEVLFKNINEYTKQDITESIDDNKTYKKLKSLYKKKIQDYRAYKNRFRLINILYNLSFAGKLIPLMFWQKEINIPSNYPAKQEFFFAKKVNLYNFLTNKKEIRIYALSKEKQLKKSFKNLYKKLDKNYDKIQSDFIKMKEKYSTQDFWKKYLGI